MLGLLNLIRNIAFCCLFLVFVVCFVSAMQSVPIDIMFLMLLFSVITTSVLGYVWFRFCLYYCKKHPEIKRPEWVAKRIGKN